MMMMMMMKVVPAFEWIEFRCVHKLYPLNRIVHTSRRHSSTWNRNQFDSLPVRSAITATAELLVAFSGQIRRLTI